MLADTRKRWRLYRMLRTIYHREGVWIWLRHAKKQGWTLDEQLQRVEQLATGAFV